jgi:putative oxidoreductase
MRRPPSHLKEAKAAIQLRWAEALEPFRMSKGKNAVLWVLQVLGAAMFFMSGFMKLSGNDQMVQMFDVIGMGQWFRYLTGLIEVASAILLLIPALAGVGALLLVPTMIGAILTHLFIIGGSPALPIGLLIAMSFVAWGRRERTLRLFKR